MRRALLAIVVCLAALATTPPARAEDRVAEARQRFQEGTELVRRAQWAEALVAFEASAKLRPHAVTTYNIAACHRALGRYTVARRQLQRVVNLGEGESKLPDSLREEAQVLIAEIDRLLVHLDVTVRPAGAAIAIDGRPLELDESQGVQVAGVAAPGAGAISREPRFPLLVDPGAHVIVLTKKGFTDQLANRSFPPGARAELVLEMGRLPATMHVEATPTGAAIAIDQVDVGISPVSISRPAGTYEVQVRKHGFLPYRAPVAVGPGEEANVRVNLVAERTSIVKKWWFWTSIGAALTGTALGAYFGARAAEEPKLDGGGLNWIVKTR